jgi:hypothetical protein
MRSDMTQGAVLPDYELSDHTGKHRKLSELQGDDPMVLVLGRGGYCPKDRRQAEGLLQLHREMEVGYCRMGHDHDRQHHPDQSSSSPFGSKAGKSFSTRTASPPGQSLREGD